jgi:hypothetical protein
MAWADGLGRTGLLALEAGWRRLIVRTDARLVYIPAGIAEIGYAGVAVGATPLAGVSTVRPYVLATVSRGADLREADLLTTVGLAGGVDLLRAHVFVEVCYENSLQRSDPFHYTLPEHQLTFCMGLHLERSAEPAAGRIRRPGVRGGSPGLG